MKLKIKNPVLRWLAGCVLIAGIIGVVGAIFWLMGWLASFLPNYYAWTYSGEIVAAPFNFIVLGLLTACGLAIAAIILIALFCGAKGIGNHYFDP